MRITTRTAIAGLALTALAACGTGGGGPDAIAAAGDLPGTDVSADADLVPVAPALVVEDLPATAPAGQPLALMVRATGTDALPVADVQVQAVVERGGGTIDPAMAKTGADGTATFTWTLGPAPVRQRVMLAGNDAYATATLEGTLAAPLQPVPFGNVDGFLSTKKMDGSTEDLAFTPDGTGMVLGVPGGLVELDPDGNATTMALTGDALGWALGLAYDANGVLWAADANGKALRRIDTDGKVTTIAVGGETPVALKYPNDLAVLPNGNVALADSCLGKVLIVTPEGRVASEVQFDAKTEGGANGVAVDPAGDALWVTTENAALLCGDGSDPGAPNGGLYRFDLSPEGRLGARTDVAPGFAQYADGITFDAEGNLYMMADRIDMDNLVLAESGVWVRPAEGGDLRPFLSVTDKGLANAAFGTGPFDGKTMFVALIAMPLLVEPNQRGVVKLDVGIGGLPLIPGPAN